MSQLEKIRYAINHFKSKDNDEWMADPIYDHFSSPTLKSVHKYHQSIPGYQQTPLVDLQQFASDIGVDKVWVKDESKRFNLNAFKVLGASYSLAMKLVTDSCDATNVEKQEPKWEHCVREVKKRKEDANKEEIILATATDGNHGYGVAWISQQLNVKSFIYMPQGTVSTRVKRIEELGAIVKVTDLSYDETVEVARRMATSNNWIFIQDTTMENYLEIPLQIMQGYSTILTEIRAQVASVMKDTDKGHLRQNWFSHVFLQAGVGSFAGGIAAALVSATKSGCPFLTSLPKIVVVEPRGAHCFFLSHNKKDGDFHAMEGNLETIMAGLNCGTPSEHGWRILKKSADAFLSCDDQITVVGMKKLYFPSGSDERIISGESGAVCVGALSEICKDRRNEKMKKELELDKNSRVLIISTEGDTDEEGFDNIVGR